MNTRKGLFHRLSKLRASKQAQVDSGALEIEKRRRIRAEAELDMYRRQSKQSDSATLANARRVAIALACRCSELADELAEIKGLKPGKDALPKDTIKTVIFQDPVPHVSPVASLAPAKTGWDVDDDDLFSVLN